ncbi:T9SS type A sorting domain-containing protein [Flavobacterium soli]|uniref:T9SS type A sorting domain-containing protein n=1 Tax=Flavobacterium soli TaxID=344881 RepID=UPI00042359AD|nr:T9SS type A sorting domain-containing protein [Flavobacterium soli]
MKKTLLFLVAFFALLVSNSTATAQTVSIVGQAVGGWPDNDPLTPDTHILSTTDNITYTITGLVVLDAAQNADGGAKFRQDGAWTINWGNANFPSGVATQNGSNILTVAGTYDVTFNRITGAYSFTNVVSFPLIGILGDAVSANGFDGPDVDMFTSDGINYTLNNYTFTTGDAKFRENDQWTNSWGSSAFPSGTALLNDPNSNIPVVGGTYNVTFNKTTLAYNFGYQSVGFLGTVLGPTGFEGGDIDLITTDGVNYSITNYALLAGEIKFRLENSWDTNWGSSDTPGVLALNGPNIVVETAGNYDISFNRNTLAYTITASALNTSEFAIKSLKVYPNPSNSIWNFTTDGTISAIEIMDVVGKIILTKNSASNSIAVDASALPQGIYFAKVTCDQAIKTIKVIKN